MVDYGAFVELEPGLEGLLHVSEMSWDKKLRNPGKLVQKGDVVDLQVLDVDTEKKRISLGMKQLKSDPWKELADRYPAGTIVEGKIKNLTDFGLFIGLEDGIDGLVHISEISWSRRKSNYCRNLQEGRDHRGARTQHRSRTEEVLPQHQEAEGRSVEGHPSIGTAWVKWSRAT